MSKGWWIFFLKLSLLPSPRLPVSQVRKAILILLCFSSITNSWPDPRKKIIWFQAWSCHQTPQQDLAYYLIGHFWGASVRFHLVFCLQQWSWKYYKILKDRNCWGLRNLSVTALVWPPEGIEQKVVGKTHIFVPSPPFATLLIIWFYLVNVYF